MNRHGTTSDSPGGVSVARPDHDTIAWKIGPLIALMFAAPAGAARCSETTDFAAAQAAVDAQVSCDAAASRREYVRAARRTLDEAPLSRACRRRFVAERLEQSTCGRPGRLVCCAVTRKGKAAHRITRPGKCTRGTVCRDARSVGGGCAPTGACLPPPGAVCPDRGTGVPRQVTFTIEPRGSDLDVGSTGAFHNFPVPTGIRLGYCLDGCDGVADTICEGRGEAGPGTLNGPTLGPPLPLVSAGVPLCIVNRFADEQLTATLDLDTGAARAGVRVLSDVFLSPGFIDEACPRCLVPGGGVTLGSVGTCSATARNPGAACLVEGVVRVADSSIPDLPLSGACLPKADKLQSTVALDLPLTTGTARLPGPRPCGDQVGPQPEDDSCAGEACGTPCTGAACVATDAAGRCLAGKGGIAQHCCPWSMPCFPTRDGGVIERAGEALGPTAEGVFAATFCVPRTASGVIDEVLGLPGPGAALLPFEAVFTPSR
jgi:hypothetical protein